MVGDSNDKLSKLNEVSIYAAWKLLGFKPKNKGKDKLMHMGGAVPSKYGSQDWTFKLYSNSSPQNYKGNKSNSHAGWGKNNKEVNDNLKKYGKRKYGIGKKGRCLNYAEPKKIRK